MQACESNAVREALIRSGIPSRKCMTIYNAAPIGMHPRLGRAAIAEMGIPEDAFVVGTVATIRPVKGIDTFLSAACLCRDITNAYWLLIGPIRDQRVRNLMRDPRISERVVALGHRRNAVELISGADLFVMPSRKESLCVALLEAMMQGVCPIVSDAGGMKEVVRHGVDGLVVPKDDPIALAQAIRQLHYDRNRLKILGKSARRRVHEEFSADQMGHRAVQIYRQLAANRTA